MSARELLDQIEQRVIAGQGQASVDRRKAADPPADPAAMVAKRQATIAARKLATGYRPGDRCRVIADVPRYGNRSGTVVTTWLGEVGVSFGAADQTEAWFRPAELERVR